MKLYLKQNLIKSTKLVKTFYFTSFYKKIEAFDVSTSVGKTDVEAVNQQYRSPLFGPEILSSVCYSYFSMTQTPANMTFFTKNVKILGDFPGHFFL